MLAITIFYNFPQKEKCWDVSFVVRREASGGHCRLLFCVEGDGYAMYGGKLVTFGCALIVAVAGSVRGELRELSLDKAIDYALGDSYRIKRLELDVEETRLWLKARKAALRTRVYMNVTAPDLDKISDYEWNSSLGREELIHRNTMLWQSELSVKQPVILLHYPTNGYVSLNCKVNQYGQKEDEWDLSYYNRVYAKYEQPFFLPNKLKNNLEEAELKLEESKLRYVDKRVDIVGDVARHYYWVFELAYRAKVFERHLDNLHAVYEATQEADSVDTMDVVQIELETANVREDLLENQSKLRREQADLRQRLGLPESDSLVVEPVIEVIPVRVDLEGAIEKAFELNPRVRRHGIWKRSAEIRRNNEKGRNAPHAKLELTYGLENTDDHFTQMWRDHDNTGSVRLWAYVPIVDWGERRARIRARQLDIEKHELSLEETREDMRKDVANAVTSVREYLERALSMQSSIDNSRMITEESISRYAQGRIDLQALLPVVQRHRETELNLLAAYLGYRRSLLDLMLRTFYDFEKGISMVDAFFEEQEEG